MCGKPDWAVLNNFAEGGVCCKAKQLCVKALRIIADKPTENRVLQTDLTGLGNLPSHLNFACYSPTPPRVYPERPAALAGKF